jgi:predicted amidohydrolase
VKIKVGVIQMDCYVGELEKNLEKAEKLFMEALNKGAEWILFPELFNTGYWVVDNEYEMAEEIPSGRTTQWMIDLAKKHEVLISACLTERSERQSVVYDTAVTLDSSGLLGKYRKVHLWDTENVRFSEGFQKPVPVSWKKGLNVGMQICYEVGFPELSRYLVLLGANVLIYPSAFGSARYYVWDIASKARALENGAYVLAPNRSGVDEDTVFFGGRSRIVAPDGSVIAEAAKEGDEVLVAELDLDKVVEQRRTVPYLRDLNVPLVKALWQDV